MVCMATTFHSFLEYDYSSIPLLCFRVIFVLVPVMCIRDVVEQALTTGLLTLEAENQLRVLLSNKYGYEDWQAFMALQSAAMVGQVQQESRSIARSPRLATYCTVSQS